MRTYSKLYNVIEQIRLQLKRVPLATICVGSSILAASILWHSINQKYPSSDSAEYVSVGQKLYLQYIKGDPIAFLSRFYGLRIWKPIFMGQLILPALLFVKGNVLASIAITLIFIYGIFLSYLGLILSAFVPKRFIPFSIVLLGTSPFVVNSSRIFMTELPFMTCILGVIYHYQKSKELTHRWHSVIFGFIGGLAIMVRPVEGILLIEPLLLTYQLKALKELLADKKDKKILINLRRIVVFYFLFLTGGVVYFNSVPLKTTNSLSTDFDRFATVTTAGLLAMAIAMLTLIYRKKRSARLYRNVLPTVILGSISCLWLLPYFWRTLNWIWSCTFGSLARATGGRGNYHGPIDFLTSIYGTLFTGIFTFLLGALLLWIAGSYKKISLKVRQDFYEATLPAIGVSLLPSVAAALTWNSDLRYHYTGCLLIEIILVAIWSNPIFPLSWLRLSIVVALGSIQLLVIGGQLAGMTLRDTSAAGIFQKIEALGERIGLIYSPPQFAEEEGISIFRQLSSKIPTNNQYRIAVIGLTNPESDSSLPFDAFTLEVIAEEQRSNWQISYPFYPDMTQDIERRRSYLASSYDYLLIGPMHGSGNDPFDHFSKEGEDIIKDWAMNSTQCSPFCLNAIIEFLPSHSKSYCRLALFKVTQETPRHALTEKQEKNSSSF